jgi:hypothetical protein
MFTTQQWIIIAVIAIVLWLVYGQKKDEGYALSATATGSSTCRRNMASWYFYTVIKPNSTAAMNIWKLITDTSSAGSCKLPNTATTQADIKTWAATIPAGQTRKNYQIHFCDQPNVTVC